MRSLFRIAPTVSAMALAATGLAPAHAASGFDGVYTGVSAGRSGGGEHCVPAETPSPLTVANGSAASATGFFTGTVDASGHAVLHTKQSTRFDGQIDGNGTLRASGTAGPCNYTMVWKKR